MSNLLLNRGFDHTTEVEFIFTVENMFVIITLDYLM